MNNITLIDDLPNLEDLEHPKTAGLSMIPPSEINRYQKFIRNNGFRTHDQSGMEREKEHHKQPVHYHPIRQYPQTVEITEEEVGIQFPRIIEQPRHHPRSHYQNMDTEQEQHPRYDIEREHRHVEQHPIPPMIPYHYPQDIQRRRCRHEDTPYSPSCIDIAEHTGKCSVCSKLYANNNTIFIFIVIFQAIVILLLLKRILETDK